MKKIVFLLLFCISFSVFSQKKVERNWNGNTLKKLVVNGNGVFKIKVSNCQDTTISVQAKIEGEYAEHLFLIDKTESETLTLSTKFQPLFKDDNDKLSAHKVLSVELEISVPKHISLDVKSDIGSAQISGNYPSVFIELQQGNCSLNPFLGNATINTIEGNISIATNNAKVEAYTKTGAKAIYQFKYGQYILSVHTINGNIKVTKFEN